MFNIETIQFIPNIFVLGAIIGIIEWCKKLDEKNKKERKPNYYAVINIIVCVLVGIALSIIDNPEKIFTLIAQALIYTFVYWGLGTLGYQTIIKFVKSFFDKLIKKVGDEQK